MQEKVRFLFSMASNEPWSGACDVVAANLPDVIPKVERPFHTLQLVLDGLPDAMQVFVRFHLGGPFVQHGRCMSIVCK